MNDKVIARQLFVSCEKVSHLRYVILNDGTNFMHEFFAKDEDTARIYFQGFLEGMNYERKRRNGKR